MNTNIAIKVKEIAELCVLKNNPRNQQIELTLNLGYSQLLEVKVHENPYVIRKAMEASLSDETAIASLDRIIHYLTTL